MSDVTECHHREIHAAGGHRDVPQSVSYDCITGMYYRSVLLK